MKRKAYQAIGAGLPSDRTTVALPTDCPLGPTVLTVTVSPSSKSPEQAQTKLARATFSVVANKSTGTIRRSSIMASGLCSSASASASSGTAVSTISWCGLKLVLMKRRTASSSSTIRSLDISSVSLAAESQRFADSKWQTSVFRPRLKYFFHLLQKSFFRERLVDQSRASLEHSVPCDKRIGIPRH